MSTESRNPRSIGLDRMSAREIVRLMNEEEMAVIRALQHAEEPLAEAALRVAEAFQAGGKIIYVGSGTSGRVAAMDAAEMPPTFGLDPDRFVAIVSGGTEAHSKARENAEDDEHEAISIINDLGLERRDVLIGIAASGNTPFVVAAVAHAKQKGVWTCGIANNKGTRLLREADLGILLDTGPEVLTGSTRLKAGTAQKLALNRISTASMVLSGKTISNLMVDVKANNRKLRERCCRIVQDLTQATFDEAWEALEKHNWSVRQAVAILSVAPAKA
ncbi:MAG: N-acetylmuramic acid 6-phosphate etherase [Fimbriimonadales bacterium]